ncbi:MAG: hypothetical protein Q7K34_02030 [archaeon]|nr:hypothetical protein [archaeon]
MVSRDKASTRFSMVKKRHCQTFFEAVEKKRADPQIISLCTFIAGAENFFTSSTCSGRIVLLKVNEQETKKEAAFHAKWHREVEFPELWAALNKKSAEELWFKMEPFIIHIGTGTVKNAEKLLEIMKKCGIKRGGIQVLKEGKIILELTGTQRISCPAKKEDRILFTEEYAREILARANKKLAKNYQSLEKFEQECRKSLT